MDKKLIYDIKEYKKYADDIARDFARDEPYLSNRKNSLELDKFIYEKQTADIPVKDYMYHLDNDKLNKYSNEFYYNHNCLDIIETMIHGITSNYAHTPPKITSIKIRHWFGSFKRVGEKSAFGKVYFAAIKKDDETEAFINNFLVIKADSRPELSANDDQFHEYCVGLYVANQMRRIGIPNFACVYGLFKAMDPIEIDNEVVFGLSESESNDKTHIVYENVINSKSLMNFFNDNSTTNVDALNAITQLLLALQIANDYTGFVHNDLHAMNVLVAKRDNSKCKYFTYNVFGKNVRIVNNGNIPVIIDYGFSQYRYFGHTSGTNDRSYESMKMDIKRNHIINDIYRLLIFLSASTNNNARLSNLISNILNFFGDYKSLCDVNVYAFYSYNENLQDPKLIKRLLQYMSEIYPDEMEQVFYGEDPMEIILDSVEDILKIVELRIGYPTSLIELTEMSTYYQKDANKYNKYMELIEDSEWRNICARKIINEMNATMKKINNFTDTVYIYQKIKNYTKIFYYQTDILTKIVYFWDLLTYPEFYQVKKECISLLKQSILLFNSSYELFKEGKSWKYYTVDIKQEEYFDVFGAYDNISKVFLKMYRYSIHTDEIKYEIKTLIDNLQTVNDVLKF